MAIETRERLSLDDILVIDADVHIHETPTALLPYVDPAWRPALENLAKVFHRYLNLPAFCPNVRIRSCPASASPPAPRRASRSSGTRPRCGANWIACRSISASCSPITS